MKTENMMWHLNKYARFVQRSKTQSKQTDVGEWEYFDSTKSLLQLTLGDSGHFLISHGSTIMESYNLFMAQKFLRGQCKGDSMIIFYHMQDVSHRFRVKFSATDVQRSDEVCRECAEKLSKYFSIKALAVDKEPNCQQNTDVTTLQGEITLSDVADVCTNTSKKQLPIMYRNSFSVSTEDMGVLLRLCLSDPSFPAFVEQVESQLKQLKSESNL